jgi:hypothetical protein
MRFRVYFTSFEGSVGIRNFGLIDAEDRDGARAEVKRLLDAAGDKAPPLQLDNIVLDEVPSQSREVGPFEAWLQQQIDLPPTEPEPEE